MNPSSLRSFCVLFCFSVLLACNSGKEKQVTGEKPADSIATAVQEKKIYVRKNAYSPAAQKDLEALKIALDKMRKLDCTNPLSWYYQGAMHWIPDFIPNGNPLCSSYTSKSKDGLLQAWQNCTHTPKSTINFLPWHRMYTYYLEQIVRQFSGYKDFAMPYWGYTDTENIQENLVMPPAYRDVAGSLYEQSRFDSLNKGYPISGATLATLNITDLFENTVYEVFNSSINAAPHGSMHVFIGGGNSASTYKIWNPIYQDSKHAGLMTQVPSAGFDPIFWMHHSNIDRLWTQWTNSPNGQKITLQQLTDNPWPYVFFEPNGNSISYTAKQVYDIIYNLDYVYDNMPGAGAAPAIDAVAEVESIKPGDTLLRVKPARKISTPGTNIPLGKIKTASGEKLMLRSSANTSGKRVILTLKVSFSKEPDGNYEVYLNLPKGTKPSQQSSSFAGFMSFFGAEHHAENADAKGGKPTVTFHFDVTDELQESKALDSGNLHIDIFKLGGLPQNLITVEEAIVSTQ